MRRAAWALAMGCVCSCVLAEPLPRNTNEITSLTIEQAKSLANRKGEILSLDGLTTLSPEVAEILAQYKGDVLSLDGLTTLSPEAAKHLSQLSGGISLDGVNSLSPEAARALAEQQSVLELPGLKTLSLETAEALARQNGVLSLDGVAMLSDEVAEVLAQHEGGLLSLNGVTSASAEAAAVLLAHPNISLGEELRLKLKFAGVSRAKARDTVAAQADRSQGGQRHASEATRRKAVKATGIEGERVRPEDGVRDADLDKAWADYADELKAVADEILATLNSQFDAAAEKGDLDEAERWQGVVEDFEARRTVPQSILSKAAFAKARARLRDAEKRLLDAYGEVIKSLTMEKRIDEAKAVRAERDLIPKVATTAGDQTPAATKSANASNPIDAFADKVEQRKRGLAGRVAPPLDMNTMAQQIDNVTTRMARQPDRLTQVFKDVLLDDGGLFRDLVEAVESGDDVRIMRSLGRFRDERLEEMDALVKETDWGRWPQKDIGLTNGQVLLAAWDAVLRQVRTLDGAGKETAAEP